MDVSLRYLKGIGPQKEKLFWKLGIRSIRDLLYYFPFKYQDRRRIAKIGSIGKEGYYAVRAEIISISSRTNFVTRKHIHEAVLQDSSGRIKAVWFNQPYLNNYLHKGDKLFIFGPVRFYRGSLRFIVPEFDKDYGESLSSGRIVPFYRLTKNVSQRMLRRIISLALEKYQSRIDDFLPFYLRKSVGLLSLPLALKMIHFPSDFSILERARERFIFEEFFLMQILVYQRKAMWRQPKPHHISANSKLIGELKARLSFNLTVSQEKALEDIVNDMASIYPMRRLLQGEVGSGKTVVAFIAMALAALSSLQVAFMVPTEILAWQHFNNLKAFLSHLPIRVEILTSSSRHHSILARSRSGKIDILVGTHALLNEKLQFKHLGLVVIDEQHRFGVAQKVLLFRKAQRPDILIMSATPIPRSLALTIYGDLDISLIKELPPGRKIPQVLIFKEEERNKAYEIVQREVKKGRQAYMIYPLIEEDGLEQAVIFVYEKLKKAFSSFRLGLLHGKLKAEKKYKVLSDFQKGEIDILVSTSVVEVGIDVPQASVMVVEGVDKFGLSQLHQLRGRISRSIFQPFFIIIEPLNLREEGRKRLRIISKTADGFKIAEEDMKLRGPGDLFGNMQTGFLSPSFADPLKDIEYLRKARYYAYQIVKKDKALALSQHRFLRERIRSDLEKCLLWQAS